MKKTISIIKLIILTGIFLLTFNSYSYGQGSTYTGTYITSSPIRWNGISNQTITGLQITNTLDSISDNTSGHCIYLVNCSNIIIQNCKLGPSIREGVHLYNCTNITIINCSMSYNATGVYAQLSSGIKVNYNDVLNVQGPAPKGSMVQFDNVSGEGNSVSYNVGENIAGQSFPNDEISLYMSNGTATSPIEVVGNWIRGGGPSTVGGGIMTGDGGGSYITVQNNILVDPGNYGIAVASGTNINISNNKIYAKQQSFCNAGIYAWNQYATPCSSLTIQNNQINYTSSSGNLGTTWNGGNCGTITGWSTNVYTPSLSAAILPTKIIGKVKGVTTGTDPAPTNVDYKIIPNPVFGESIIVTSESPGNEKISIYNLIGQMVINQSLTNNRTEINTRNLITGIYLVMILKNNKTVEVRKIIVRRN